MSTVAPFVAVSTTVRPNRRPPRPKHPKFTQFHRSGLHFGRIHPQHRQYGDSSKAYGIATASVGGGRAWPNIGNDSPSEARGADGERAGRSASITTTPQEWRAPEGPEGLAGLRGAAPNEVRSPSLAGGRTLRRPEHQRGLAALPVGGGRAWPDDETTHRTTRQQPAPPAWRAPEGPEGTEGQAAVPVGGGRAWPDNEPTRRAKLAARTASGRADPHQSPRPHRCGGRRRDRRARAGFEARRRTK